MVYVASARVYADAMYFFDSSATEARKIGILKAYNSAAKLIRLMIEADAVCDFFLHVTAYQLGMLHIASCILLKVLRSSYAQDIDIDVGKRLFNEALVAIS